MDDVDAHTPDDRLPDPEMNAAELRAVFSRLGFGDREIVTLIGNNTNPT